MRVKLTLEYEAERDEPDESAADEERALDLIEGRAREFIEDLRQRCAREGLKFIGPQ